MPMPDRPSTHPPTRFLFEQDYLATTTKEIEAQRQLSSSSSSPYSFYSRIKRRRPAAAAPKATSPPSYFVYSTPSSLAWTLVLLLPFLLPFRPLPRAAAAAARPFAAWTTSMGFSDTASLSRAEPGVHPDGYQPHSAEHCRKPHAHPCTLLPPGHFDVEGYLAVPKAATKGPVGWGFGTFDDAPSCHRLMRWGGCLLTPLRRLFGFLMYV